jgi:hypothetical protein
MRPLEAGDGFPGARSRLSVHGPGAPPEIFEQRLDDAKIGCRSRGCRGGGRARALVVRRRRQKLEQSGVQILLISSRAKHVLCRECRDRCPGKLADDPIDLAGIEAVIPQQQLGGAGVEIRQSGAGKAGVGGGQLLVIAVIGEGRSVVAARERRPIAALQRRVHPLCSHEARHPHDLLVLAVDHLGDHVLDVAETRCGGVEAHDLAEPPGGALERRAPIAGDRFLQPLVLVRPLATVAASGSTNFRVGRVEAPPGAATENMTFEKNLGPPVREKTAAGGLDDQHRPEYGRIHPDMLCRASQTLPTERQCCSRKCHANPRVYALFMVNGAWSIGNFAA